MHDHIEHFLVALRQQGRARSTVNQYRWHLDRLERHLHQPDITLIDRHALRTWGAALTDTWSPATTRQAICAARSFFAWTTAEGITTTNPALALHLPRVHRRVQRTLTIPEVRALLDRCDDSLTGTRNRAIIATLLDTGLRSSELCRLDLAGLDLPRHQLHVTVKGGGEGIGFYSETTAGYITAWLAVRPAQPAVTACFVGIGGRTPGQPLTPPGLRCILRKLGASAGVRGVSPHAFRRSFATMLIRAGAPTRAVQLLGRWSNIEMVERYTADLQLQQLGSTYSAMDYLQNRTTEHKHGV